MPTLLLCHTNSGSVAASDMLQRWAGRKYTGVVLRMPAMSHPLQDTNTDVPFPARNLLHARAGLIWACTVGALTQDLSREYTLLIGRMPGFAAIYLDEGQHFPAPDCLPLFRLAKGGMVMVIGGRAQPAVVTTSTLVREVHAAWLTCKAGLWGVLQVVPPSGWSSRCREILAPTCPLPDGPLCTADPGRPQGR